MFNNREGAVFDMRSDSLLNDVNASGSEFNNEGTFRKSGGTDTGAIGWRFHNRGVVEVQSGRL
ncbi:MAG: hypothetical protein ACYSWU_23620, partial [Planctomycetota bacterium]